MNIIQQFKYNNSNDYELIKGTRKQVIKLINPYPSYVVDMQIRHILTHIICMLLIIKQNAIYAHIRLT
jgi:hypothetical protein